MQAVSPSTAKCLWKACYMTSMSIHRAVESWQHWENFLTYYHQELAPLIRESIATLAPICKNVEEAGQWCRETTGGQCDLTVVDFIAGLSRYLFMQTVNRLSGICLIQQQHLSACLYALRFIAEVMESRRFLPILERISIRQILMRCAGMVQIGSPGIITRQFEEDAEFYRGERIDPEAVFPETA